MTSASGDDYYSDIRWRPVFSSRAVFTELCGSDCNGLMISDGLLIYCNGGDGDAVMQ